MRVDWWGVAGLGATLATIGGTGYLLWLMVDYVAAVLTLHGA